MKKRILAALLSALLVAALATSCDSGTSTSSAAGDASEAGTSDAADAGGDSDTFIAAVRMLRPGGIIGNVNYLGSGDYVRLPRAEWGCGMGHKTLAGGLMPGGRLRMEKLAALMETGRLTTAPLLTHRFHGFEHMEEALMLMKDKPRDLIKPVVMMD